MKITGEDPATPASGVVHGNTRPRVPQSAARALERINKRLSMVIMGLVFVAVIEAVVIWKLRTINNFYPVVLKLHDKQFVEVKPVFEGAEASKLAKEAFVREYIIRRESFDPKTVLAHWQWVRAHSDEEGVWKPFYQVMHYEKAAEAAEKNGETWHIAIKAAYPLIAGNDERWAVEFTKERVKNGKRLKDFEGWVATVELGRLSAVTSDREELLTNPLRLAVRLFDAHQKEFIESGRTDK